MGERASGWSALGVPRSLIKPGHPLPVTHARDLTDWTPPPIDWLVKGLMVAGDKIVCAGSSGAQKSWILLDLLIHVAAEKEWLGFKVPKARSVLYVDEEMNQDTLHLRWSRLMRGAGVSDIPMAAMSQKGFKFNHILAGGDMVQAVKLSSPSFDPEVICMEALVRVIRGSDNSSEDISQFWQFVTPLLTSHRTFIVSHHMTKPGDPSLPHRPLDQDVRGSGDIKAGCDCLWTVSRKVRDDVQDDVSSVQFWKQRSAKEPKPFQVWVNDLGPHDRCADGEHYCPARVEMVVRRSPRLPQ